MGTIIDEDQALVAAAVKGSKQAWIDLVARYESRIYNQALRLTGNSADALDLMQEVFIGIYKNLHRFRGESKFSSWVFRIVHNKSIDLARRWRPPVENKPSEETDQLARLPAVASDEPDEQLAQEQMNARYRSCSASCRSSSGSLSNSNFFSRRLSRKLDSRKTSQRILLKRAFIAR